MTADLSAKSVQALSELLTTRTEDHLRNVRVTPSASAISAAKDKLPRALPRDGLGEEGESFFAVAANVTEVSQSCCRHACQVSCQKAKRTAWRTCSAWLTTASPKHYSTRPCCGTCGASILWLRDWRPDPDRLSGGQRRLELRC